MVENWMKSRIIENIGLLFVIQYRLVRKKYFPLNQFYYQFYHPVHVFLRYLVYSSALKMFSFFFNSWCNARWKYLCVSWTICTYSPITHTPSFFKWPKIKSQKISLSRYRSTSSTTWSYTWWRRGKIRGTRTSSAYLGFQPHRSQRTDRPRRPRNSRRSGGCFSWGHRP